MMPGLPSSPPPRPPASPAPAAHDIGTVLQQAVIALQAVIDTKPNTERLMAEMVRICGQALRAGGAGVWVTEIPDRPELIIEHNLPTLQLLVEGVPAKGVTAGVRRCAREGKPLIVPPFFTDSETGAGVDAPVNPSPFELLFVPMKLHGKTGLVLVMAVPPPPAHDTSLHRTYLNFLGRMVGNIEQTLTERHLSLIEKDRGTSNKLVRFADQVHKHLFLGQVAADICNLARDILEADRVTVELYPRMKKKVIAVSNVDEPNRRANLLQVQRLIFDYVRDRHVPVVLDREAARHLVSDPMLQDAASAYFAACDFDAFLAAPIKADDPTAPVLGVLLVEYSTSERAQAHSNLLAEIARLSTGSVGNAIEMESVPLIKPFMALREIWRKPTASKRATLLTVIGIVVIAIAIMGVIPFDFSIKADCQIRPSAQLSIVAPVEERIVEIPVRAGEHVYPREKQAQLGALVKPLAVFDSTDFWHQKAEATGKLGELQVKLKDSEKKGDSAKVATQQKEIEQVQGQIDLIQHEIDKCTVWSPIEGTVLTENVEQKRWSTPKKSEPLMEVASFSDWELVVDVPEGEVAGVRGALDRATRTSSIDGRADEGIEVEYILTPWPDTRYSIRAKGSATLLPASQQSKNANVFRLQVKLDPKSLPPNIAMSGVTGRAKLHIGRKPLATQWLRGAVRMMKMTLLF
jgi:multidrug resistance efflux pump